MPRTWSKLKLIEACCDVTLDSHVDPSTRILRWKLTARHRELPNAPTIIADSEDITEAVREGLRLAAEAGWIENGIAVDGASVRTTGLRGSAIATP